MDSKHSRKKRLLPDLLEGNQVAYVGIFMVISITLCGGVGYWVDNRWHTSPKGLLIGLGLGIITAFRELYLVGKRYQQSLRAASSADRTATSTVPIENSISEPSGTLPVTEKE